MSEFPFIIKERKSIDSLDTRFILVDPTTGEIIDDAQGHGYKTKQNAIKAGWYKFNGGKEKLDNLKKRALRFWKDNEIFAKAIFDYFEINFNEIARRENDPHKDIVELAKKMNIVDFDCKYLKYGGIND